MGFKSWVVLFAAVALLTAPAVGQWVLKVEPNHSTVGFSIYLVEVILLGESGGRKRVSRDRATPHPLEFTSVDPWG